MKMTAFGQIVLGPPGSGKTKYCAVLQEVLTNLGRTVCVVNLDPANDRLIYECALNIFDLINVHDVMVNCNLGPNGALMYCMEFLEKNCATWLKENIEALIEKSKSKTPNEMTTAPYFLFDLPGQVELYTHHESVRNIIATLVNDLDIRLCTVNLVDSYYVTDPSKFISVLLMSLSSMLRTELPHVNILSKMDLIKKYGKLAFHLDYYTDVLDLSYLVDTLDSEKTLAKFKKLNAKICDVVSDYGLVSFVPLNIQRQKSVLKCVAQIDKANGYLFGHLDDAGLMESVSTSNELEDDDEIDSEEENQDQNFDYSTGAY